VADWACGGNVYAHIAYERQRQLKAEALADALSRIGHVTWGAPIPVAASPEEGYRMRARFHVRGRTLGFFREGTHHLCDPATTGQLLPETCRLLEDLASCLAGGRLNGVTEIELAESIAADQRALHLELDRPSAPIGLDELSRLPSVRGVSASFTARGERGRPGVRRTITAGGDASVEDVFLPAVPEGWTRRAAGEVHLQHRAQAFFQSNRFLLPVLAGRVLSLVPDGPVVDLYAGVGLFSVSLAAAGWTSVTAVEGDPAGAADLRLNAKPLEGRVTAVEMAVERYLEQRPAGPECTVIVDPPRTGMSKEAMKAIAGQAARRLVYVSCDVATLARDTRRLIDAGYELEQLEGFDLFPNTAHVEGIAVFSRLEG
jgi:23S rRNA (uracil1939-C5)-methyltransferase